MDQYLLIPVLGGWTSINRYFDVNYRGTLGFDTLPFLVGWIGICVANINFCWFSSSCTSLPGPNAPNFSQNVPSLECWKEKSTASILNETHASDTCENLPFNWSNISRFGADKQDSTICSTYIDRFQCYGFCKPLYFSCWISNLRYG